MKVWPVAGYADVAEGESVVKRTSDGGVDGQMSDVVGVVAGRDDDVFVRLGACVLIRCAGWMVGEDPRAAPPGAGWAGSLLRASGWPDAGDVRIGWACLKARGQGGIGDEIAGQ